MTAPRELISALIAKIQALHTAECMEYDGEDGPAMRAQMAAGVDLDDFIGLNAPDLIAALASQAKGAEADGLEFEPDETHTVADMANVGFSLMATLAENYPEYSWNQSPAEVVCDLLNEIHDLKATPPAQREQGQDDKVDGLLVCLSERVQEANGEGFWQPCSGCYDSEDGHPTGPYPHSALLNCAIGSGCPECGGLGAVWHYIDPVALAESHDEPAPAEQSGLSSKEAWWAGYRAGKGLPANMPRQEAVAAEQSAVMVPDGFMLFPVDAWKFLNGEGPLDGCWFSEQHASRGGHWWWRSYIREMLAAPSPAPSAGLAESHKHQGFYQSNVSGISRSAWHDKAWALYHAKTFADTQLAKVNIHTIRAVFDATYDALRGAER